MIWLFFKVLSRIFERKLWFYVCRTTFGFHAELRCANTFIVLCNQRGRNPTFCIIFLLYQLTYHYVLKWKMILTINVYYLCQFIISFLDCTKFVPIGSKLYFTSSENCESLFMYWKCFQLIESVLSSQGSFWDERPAE